MSQEQLNRMEEMLSTLVKTVGAMMEEQTIMKQDIKANKEGIASLKDEMTSMKDEVCSLKDETASMKDEVCSLKEIGEKRHQEVMKELRMNRADNDLLWEKTNKHEREIGMLKKLHEN